MRFVRVRSGGGDVRCGAVQSGAARGRRRRHGLAGWNAALAARPSQSGRGL